MLCFIPIDGIEVKVENPGLKSSNCFIPRNSDVFSLVKFSSSFCRLTMRCKSFCRLTMRCKQIKRSDKTGDFFFSPNMCRCDSAVQSGLILMLFSCIVWLKLVSYAHTNYDLRALANSGKVKTKVFSVMLF